MAHQLSYYQRQQIKDLLGEGKSHARIARHIGVHRSTVKRELDRNSVNGKYCAFEAHSMALGRKIASGRTTCPPVRCWRSRRKLRTICQKMLPGYRSPALISALYYRNRFADFRTGPMCRKRYYTNPYRYFFRSPSYWHWKSLYEKNYRFRMLRRIRFVKPIVFRHNGNQSFLHPFLSITARWKSLMRSMNKGAEPALRQPKPLSSHRPPVQNPSKDRKKNLRKRDWSSRKPQSYPVSCCIPVIERLIHEPHLSDNGSFMSRDRANLSFLQLNTCIFKIAQFCHHGPYAFYQ